MMPIVKIELLEGRSDEVKDRLAQAVTEAFTEIAGTPPDATTVVFVDVSPANWFVAGKSMRKT